jgi:outer membrane immunogenic protein
MIRYAVAAAAAFFAMPAMVAPAFAADLPNRYAPAPYYEPAPVFTWSGLYVGINGQFGIGSYTQGGGSVFGSPTGGLGGGTVGYNYQSGRLVIGAEGDIAFGSLSDSGSFGAGTSGTGTINTIGTARVRAGYVWDRALIYLTGGYAGTGLNGKINDFGGSPNLIMSESHYLNGYAVGAGVEYAITTKISVKGEYLFTGFNSSQYFSGTRDSISSGANISLIRAGLNYHF